MILTLREFEDLLDIVAGDRDVTEELKDCISHFMDERKYAKAKSVTILEYYR